MNAPSRKKFKHYKTPRMNALSSAQYCAASDPLERSAILQASRYQRIAGIHQLGEARRAATSFLIDTSRRHHTIETAKKGLTRKIQAPFSTDFQRETAERNLESLELFESEQQRLGLGRFGFIDVSTNQPPLTLAEVPVSVRLDVLVIVSDSPDGASRCGGAIIQFAKKGFVQDAKRQETRRRNEEQRLLVNRFVAVLIYQHLLANFEALGEPSRNHCIVIDPRIGDTFSVYGRLETQAKRLEIACGEIANQWASIDPPRDFDGN